MQYTASMNDGKIPWILDRFTSYSCLKPPFSRSQKNDLANGPLQGRSLLKRVIDRVKPNVL
jgi:hypothetical protein